MVGNQTSIDCPTCRQVSNLAEGGVQALQTNFYVVQMKDTMAKIGSPKTKGCHKHSQQPMSFFCQKCAISICRDCTVLDHKQTEGHNIMDITTANREHRERLERQVQTSKETLIDLKTKLKELRSERENMTVVKRKTESLIQKSFGDYIGLLNARREQLLSQVNEKFNSKQQTIKDKVADLKTLHDNLSNSLGRHNDMMKGSLFDVVTMTTEMNAMVHDVTKEMGKFDLGLNYMTFDCKYGLDNFSDSILNLGNISTEKTLPSNIHFQAQSELTACLPVTMIIHVTDLSNTPLPGYPIGAKIYDPLVDLLTVEIATGDTDGEYKVSFTPQMSGKHRLIPTFHEHPIRECETVITVKSNNPVGVIGCPGNGGGKLQCPRAIALDSEENLYIADTGNKLIQKFSSDGTFEREFSINTGTSGFSTCDLALDKKNELIICTETLLSPQMVPTMGDTVALYNLDGSVKQKFSNKAMKCGLCVASNGRGDVIVSDYLVHSLFMYDKQGNFLRRICSSSGGFNHPAFICCDDSNNIIVSDTNNDSVQVFNGTGLYRFQFGQTGSGKGQMKQPFGVGTNGDDIVVVDNGNKRLQIFNKNGKFVGMIESKDSPLNQPRGVAVTKDGHIYVADRNNHCIKKYKYK